MAEPRTEREMAENYARMLGYDPAEVLVPVEPRTLPTEDAIKDAIKQGWWPNTRDRLSFSYRKATRAVLALFAAQPTVAQAKAEALREAAEAIDYADYGLATRRKAEVWLRARADRIERGDR